MEYQEPTYEEYKKATQYGRFKYKFSLYILILCWICLIFLCYFIYSYGEELRSNPMIYAMRKGNLDCMCTCTNNIGEMIFLDINSSSLVINGGKKVDIDWNSINISG